MRNRVLVIGATGQVGDALTRAWKQRGAEIAGATYHCHAGGRFRQLDIRDGPGVRRLLQEIRPGLVALTAAMLHVDYCELHPEEARRVNVEGSLEVLKACRAVGARMVFFSSDYVFDGRRSPYGEDDPTCPINVYGRQKAEVEAAALTADEANIVVRSTGIYGWQWEPKNFVLQVLRELGAGRRMKVAEDVSYNPTYAENLAAATVAISALGHGGIFHVVGQETILRLEFARKVARAFGLSEALLVPVSSSELGSPTPRPRESALKTDKVRRLLPTAPLWGPDEGLRHMIAFQAAWKEHAAAGLPRFEPAVGLRHVA